MCDPSFLVDCRLWFWGYNVFVSTTLLIFDLFCCQHFCCWKKVMFSIKYIFVERSILSEYNVRKTHSFCFKSRWVGVSTLSEAGSVLDEILIYAFAVWCIEHTMAITHSYLPHIRNLPRKEFLLRQHSHS
jgi:hypothetical protein